MDAAFIEQNQIVERYLGGKLPLKGAQDFERYCKDHPETLIKLGMAERINAGLRLMDASGQPEPWAEKPAPFYQKPALTAGLAASVGALLVVVVMLLLSGQDKDKRIATLTNTVQKQPMWPAKSTRTISIQAARTGPVTRSMATIGGSDTEFGDLKIDVSWSRYNNFRVTIDRVDQGRVAVLGNLMKDSNGQLRMAFNSSVLGPGQYQVALEGLDWRGSPQPEAWLSFTITR